MTTHEISHGRDEQAAHPEASPYSGGNGSASAAARSTVRRAIGGPE